MRHAALLHSLLNSPAPHLLVKDLMLSVREDLFCSCPGAGSRCRRREAHPCPAPSFAPPSISLLPISPQSPRNFKAQEYAPGRIRLLRLSPSPCRCDSEHSPQHPLSLRAGSPARVEMEIGLGRVKLLDVFICFLSSHLLMSLSPQADPSSEPKHAVLDKRGCCMANLRDCMLSEGQRGEPPGSSSPLRKLPCAAEGPGGGGGRRPRSGVSLSGAGDSLPGRTTARSSWRRRISSSLISTVEGSRGRCGGGDNSFPTRNRARL